MRSLISVFFLTWALAALAVGQTPADPLKPVDKNAGLVSDWGSFADGKFVSSRFGITISVPSTFQIFPAQEMEAMNEAGRELLIKGKNSEQIDDAILGSIKVFVISEKPFGSLENSALDLVVGKQQKGVTANMVLASNLEMLRGSALILKRSLSPLRMKSNVFAAAEFEATMGNVKFHYRMYVVMHRGYSLVFSNAYFNEKQRTEIENVLSTLTLK